MNIWDSFKHLFSRKLMVQGSGARSFILNPATAVSMPKEYSAYASEAYEKNNIAYACVGMRAEACADIPWLLYDRRGNEVLEHPLLDLLARPNVAQAKASFLIDVFSYMDIAGNSYVRAVSVNGTPRELWALQPDRMRITPGMNRLPGNYVHKIYRLNQDPVEEVYPVDQLTGASEILHMKYFHPQNMIYGMSPIEATAFGVDTYNESLQMFLSILRNKGVVGGVVSTQGTLAEHQYEQLKDQIEEQFTGSRNAGRTMILEGGMEWKPMAFSPVDLAWLEGKNTTARDIALAFKVPPMLLGIPGDNTYSNYKEARQAFYETAVVPLASRFTDELNRWLVPQFDPGLWLDIDREAIDALAPKREAIWDQTRQADFLTINEKRERVGYEPIENGDVIFVGMGSVTLADAVGTGDPGLGQNTDGSNQSETNLSQEATNQEASAEDAGSPGKQASRHAPRTRKAARLSLEDEVKLFNLRDSHSRSREWRRQEQMRKRLEKSFSRQLQALFVVEGEAVRASVKGLTPLEAEVAARHEIDDMSHRWRTVIENNLMLIGHAFGSRVLSSLKWTTGGHELKSAEDRFREAFRNWVRNRAGTMVTGITATSKDAVVDAIRGAIIESADEGEGSSAMGNRIREAIGRVYDGDDEIEGFTRARGETIARTESVAASNAGSLEAARETGIPDMRKQWVAADDERTRKSHAEANEQTVALDDPFLVGGHRMSMPGDNSAPPEETINCRCAVVYVGGGE